MMIRAVILWIHVLCGVVWIGACATFVLAATALAGEPGEAYAFAVRAAPQINRLCVPMAIAIPITGMGNLFFAVRTRGVALPAEFLGIVAAKVVLLAVMTLGLFGAWRAALRLHEQSQTGESESHHESDVRRMTALYGLIVVAGIVALGLGLWLSGT
jgi:hypothetical protein